MDLKWGVINEDGFSLRSPRTVDNEHEHFSAAMEEAGLMLARGEAEQVSVVRCRYSPKDAVWVEVAGTSIELTLHGNGWQEEDL